MIQVKANSALLIFSYTATIFANSKKRQFKTSDWQSTTMTIRRSISRLQVDLIMMWNRLITRMNGSFCSINILLLSSIRLKMKKFSLPFTVWIILMSLFILNHLNTKIIAEYRLLNPFCSSITSIAFNQYTNNNLFYPLSL